MKNYRVGLGFDVHRINTKKKDLILGGAKIPASFSLKAVSDGDVVLHAISDGVCGACGLGDIGDYFPPFKKSSKDISSGEIAKFILNKIKKKFKIINVDITIVADEPKLFPYKKKMLKSLTKIFSFCGMNIKIKSKEGLNILGGKNSIACMALVVVKTR